MRGVRLHPQGRDMEMNDRRSPMSRWRWMRSLYRSMLRVRRWLWLRGARLRVEQLGHTSLVVLPGVFDGLRLRTGAFLAHTLDAARVPAGARVLDLGTGSGIGAIAAARWAGRVVASDINPEAVRCVQINALLNHLEQLIEPRVGDLFAPVGNERFDLILFNPPFYRGQPRTMLDHAWRSPDAFDRFLRELPAHLSPDGRALVVLSSDNDIEEALWSASHLSISIVRQQDLFNELLTVYELTPRTARASTLAPLPCPAACRVHSPGEAP